jgi:uncharacterized membrane protein YccC
MVVAAISRQGAWTEPIPRLLDTIVGMVVGVVGMWIGLAVTWPRPESMRRSRSAPDKLSR